MAGTISFFPNLIVSLDLGFNLLRVFSFIGNLQVSLSDGVDYCKYPQVKSHTYKHNHHVSQSVPDIDVSCMEKQDVTCTTECVSHRSKFRSNTSLKE